ncbi:MAG: isoprenylcysteine carboxylmethyltransferase family protein [Candidatus Omnitrophica bacterium]|nr:isoprenylcysteine carboxylmethyltransferase family protein [Candidatus Omnitrophota bacterium]
MTKPRVQLDALVIGSCMILTALLVLIFPYLYNDSAFLRDVFAVVGFVLIILGALLRMSARGYKKFSSNQSCSLVIDGPYKFVRNPMYLGTFLIGVGFMCPLFPLWTIAIFSTVFYFRFIIQIKKEEATLLENFGQAYRDYCSRVRVFIPTLKSFTDVNFNEVFSRKHLWSTKEKYGLFCWPILNLAFWFLQQHLFWRKVSIIPVVADAVFVMVLIFWMMTSISEGNRWIIPGKS